MVLAAVGRPEPNPGAHLLDLSEDAGTKGADGLPGELRAWLGAEKLWLYLWTALMCVWAEDISNAGEMATIGVL